MRILNLFSKNWYHLIGVLIILYLVLFEVNLKDIVEVLIQAKVSLIVLAALMVVLMSAVQSWRWNYLKKIQGINYSFKDSFLIYNAGLYVGIITPGRIGDLIKIGYLKKDGFSVGQAAVSVITDRLVDISFLLVFGYFSVLWFARLFSREATIMSILLATIIIVITLITIQRKLLGDITKRMIVFFLSQKKLLSWQLNYDEFVTGVKKYYSKKIVAVLAATIMAWLVYYLQMFVLAKSINLNISFTYIAMAVTISALATLIPISFYGLGTRDAVLIFLLANVGIGADRALAFSTLILFTILVMGLVGFVCWLKRPDLNPNKNHNSFC